MRNVLTRITDGITVFDMSEKCIYQWIYLKTLLVLCGTRYKHDVGF